MTSPGIQWGDSHLEAFQVTVGSGRPSAKQKRLTLPPSFKDTSWEMLTILAGTAGGIKEAHQ